MSIVRRRPRQSLPIAPDDTSPRSSKRKKRGTSYRLNLFCYMGGVILCYCLLTGFHRHREPTSFPLRFERNATNVPWEDFREFLCPEGKRPRVELGPTLFLVSMGQLRNESSEVVKPSSFRRGPKSSSGSVDRFFQGAYGERQGDGIAYLPLYDLSIGNEHRSRPYLFYIRIWKCANDQIRNELRRNFPEFDDWQSWFAFPPTKHTRLHRRQHQTTCIVTAIRDPIAHFLSGYNEIESRWLGRASPSGFTEKEKDRLRPCFSYVEQPTGSNSRFEQFVKDLLLSETAQYCMMEHWMFEHSFPTSRVLAELDELGLSLTAYLPSLDELSTRWPTFLKEQCPGYESGGVGFRNSSRTRHSTQGRMESTGQHWSSSDPHHTYRAARQVWEEQGSIAKAICVLHALDYACWRDLPGGIPTLCQEVYASQSFQSRLLAALP